LGTLAIVGVGFEWAHGRDEISKEEGLDTGPEKGGKREQYQASYLVVPASSEKTRGKSHGLSLHLRDGEKPKAGEGGGSESCLMQHSEGV